MIFERIKSDGLAHINGSYSIWLEGLPAYAGWVLTYEKPILLALECRDHLDKAICYLVRLGYDNIVGHLRGGIEAWYDSSFKIEYMGLSSVHDLKQRLDSGEDVLVLDVRDDNEWKEGHIKGALHTMPGNSRAGYPNVCCDVNRS